MYHGWNDQLIQPYNSIDYFTSVQKKMGTRDTDDFARLFMAPGMQHCAGGVGPNTFDAVTALEQWVEKDDQAGADDRVTHVERRRRSDASAVSVSAGGELQGSRQHGRSGELRV